MSEWECRYCEAIVWGACETIGETQGCIHAGTKRSCLLKLGDKFENPWDESSTHSGVFVGTKRHRTGIRYQFKAPDGQIWWMHEDNVGCVLKSKPHHPEQGEGR